MPSALVKPCMLAGTSEYGVCDVCAAPFERVVERARTLDGEPAELGAARSMSRAAPSRAQGVGHGRIATSVREIGWEPTCGCPLLSPDAPFRVPATVLDPFAGSGTVGVVATALGRDAILVELNPDYAEIARKRTAQQGLFATTGTPEQSAARTKEGR